MRSEMKAEPDRSSCWSSWNEQRGHGAASARDARGSCQPAPPAAPRRLPHAAVPAPVATASAPPPADTTPPPPAEARRWPSSFRRRSRASARPSTRTTARRSRRTSPTTPSPRPTGSPSANGRDELTKAMDDLFATFGDAKSVADARVDQGQRRRRRDRLDRDDDGRLHGDEGHEEAGRPVSASTSCGSTTTASSRRCTSTATTRG